MLIGLWIRDVVLIEALDLSIGPGLTALTGETGAGKSIILDALGLATGARADAGLVRRGASQAAVSAVFAPRADHPVWDLLEDKGLSYARDEDLVLRRTLGRRPQPRLRQRPGRTGVGGAASELGRAAAGGARPARDRGPARRPHPPAAAATPSASLNPLAATVAQRWADLARRPNPGRRPARSRRRSAAESEELALRLSELDRLDPHEGEETELAEERASWARRRKRWPISPSARSAFDGLASRLAQAVRALEHARTGAIAAGRRGGRRRRCSPGHRQRRHRPRVQRSPGGRGRRRRCGRRLRLRPDQLEKTEERLFELRGTARKLSVSVEELPILRVRFAERLRAMESSEDDLKAAERRRGRRPRSLSGRRPAS